MPTIFVITGTTAVGKTELSLQWAKQNNAEILSCDSTNVYKGMDIGTAKPSLEEQKQIPHHGIDLVSPNERFSVFDYVQFAQKTVNDIFSRGKNLLVTGGSGFYLKAFYAPVIDEINVPETIRQHVEQINALGPEHAKEQLQKLNPDGAPEFDWQNPRRVTRALERCLSTGKSISTLRKEMLERPSAFAQYPIQTLLLQRNPTDLEKRIRQRTQQMLKIGLIDEIKQLLKNKLLIKNTPAGNAIGYRETIDWLENNELGGIETLAETINISTRQLAAKQRKWFRHQIKIDEIRELS